MKFLLHVAILVLLTGLAVASTGSMQIYAIDVEGGQSTLIVSPTGHAMLIDAGWADSDGRDAERILSAAKAAGVQRIDYLVVTHYHRDHVGGVPQLAERIPIGTFVDHGPNTEEGEQAKSLYSAYEQALAKSKSKHLVVKPGDVIPLSGLNVQVLSAAGSVIASSTAKTEANPLCASEPAASDDKSENAASVGMLITYGKFRMLDMGDLTKRKEFDLVCPENRIGRVDLFIVSHHGLNQSNSKAFVQTLHAKAAIMNNGVHKGGNAEAWLIVHDSPGLQDLWQLHYAADSDPTRNSNEKLIANQDQVDGNYIKVAAKKDGSFVVTNSRNGVEKRY